jgi:hypothetical protein
MYEVRVVNLSEIYILYHVAVFLYDEPFVLSVVQNPPP